VSYLVVVNAASPGSGTPTGSVDLKDTTTSTDYGLFPLTGGSVTITLPSGFTVGGSHSLTATYVPGSDPNFNGSSTTFTQSVTSNLPATNLSAVKSVSTVTAGSPFSITVTAKDKNGNVTTALDGQSTTIKVILTSGSGSAVTGTLTATFHNGTAVFSSITVAAPNTNSTYDLRIFDPVNTAIFTDVTFSVAAIGLR
jgi:hypothetical protein